MAVAFYIGLGRKVSTVRYCRFIAPSAGQSVGAGGEPSHQVFLLVTCCPWRYWAMLTVVNLPFSFVCLSLSFAL